MNTTHNDHHTGTPRTTGLSSPLRTTLLMVVLVGGFFLLREHWNFVAGNWIYLLLLVCPLMHFFHGHDRHGDHVDPTARLSSKKE
ncbi:DUF2933 domain-containing protein [Hydrogenophaga sp. PAMC20947]|uniref:DUF2933 domain-containing protein n=1 Tax=Hydrogenophaga sp. PAMC20947 TaxID=2565558 RepID=UPI001B35088E|nr:DUF2933 domain-containing protein [Hydrogenophaga sp. PAMC20947]